MSATIYPECGHARHMMEVDCFNGSPQIHLHFLTEQDEFATIGYMKVEFCCHGCGTSLLVYYLESDAASPRHVLIKSNFEKTHKLCPNRNYEELCPNQRSSFSVIDMRPVRRRKKPSGPVAHPIRKRPVSPVGSPLVGNGRSPVRKKEAEG